MRPARRRCVPLSTLRALAAVVARSTGDLDRHEVMALLDWDARWWGWTLLTLVKDADGQVAMCTVGDECWRAKE